MLSGGGCCLNFCMLSQLRASASYTPESEVRRVRQHGIIHAFRGSVAREDLEGGGGCFRGRESKPHLLEVHCCNCLTGMCDADMGGHTQPSASPPATLVGLAKPLTLGCPPLILTVLNRDCSTPMIIPIKDC